MQNAKCKVQNFGASADYIVPILHCICHSLFTRIKIMQKFIDVNKLYVVKTSVDGVHH